MFTCQTLLVLNQHRTMHHSSPRSPWQQNLCLSGSETARERASFKYSSAGAPVDGCPLMLICFRFPQLDALSHECAWTFAEAGQVSGLAGTRIPAAPHVYLSVSSPICAELLLHQRISKPVCGRWCGSGTSGTERLC